MIDILALADDLTGAVEIAPLLGLRGSRTMVILCGANRMVDVRGVDVRGVDVRGVDVRGADVCGADVRGADPDAPRVVLDLDARHLPAAAIAQLLDHVLGQATVTATPILFAKIDSLLRGPVEAIVAALRRHRPGLVIAPAVPELGRTVRDGIVRLDDRALHHTDAWSAEAGSAPASVAEALPSIPTRTIALDIVRSPDLIERLTGTLATGWVPVCDAETEADLDAIARAATAIDGACLIGAGGLAAALGRVTATSSGSSTDPDAPAPPADPGTALLVVVGSADRIAGAQAAALLASGGSGVQVPFDDLMSGRLAGWVDAVIDALAGGPAVVTVGPRNARGQASIADRAVSRELAELVAAVDARIRPPIGLVLIGGETARRVLDRLAITRLAAHDQIHHGAVRCTAADGRVVVTRPGRFGGPDSLLSIVTALRPGAAAHPRSVRS